ncbi:MAG: GumC family protein [Armatimonadota bacterium]
MEPGLYSAVDTPVTVRDVLGVVWRRLWVILLVTGAALGTAAYVSFTTPPRWRAEAQVILVQRTPAVLPDQTSGRDLRETISTQVAMLRSYAMAIRTINYLKNKALEGAISEDVLRDLDPEKLVKNLEVGSPEGTDIVQIRVVADSRAKAETLANAICEAFVEWKREVAQQSAADTVNTLEERVATARARLAEAEQKEQDFKRTHRMVDVSAETQAAVEQYLKHDAEVVQAQQEVSVQEARVAELTRRLQAANRAIEQGTGVRDDSLVLSLQQRLNALEMERANAALRIRPGYPGAGSLEEIDAQIADVKKRLAAALQGTLDNKRPSLEGQAGLSQALTAAQLDLRNARARLAAATAARNRARAKTADVPDTSLEYARLARETELAKTLYTTLQRNLSAARLDKDSASGNVQISQYAFVPEKPFEPNHPRNLLFGLAVGLALSFAVVLILEQADTRVRSVDDVRELVPGPVVGALPRWSQSELKELMSGSSTAPVEEAYSLARVNLSLALRQAANGDDKMPQVVLVTSAMPGEGKSLTAAQMARSLARAGNRVILVDADLRRPTQNELFGTAEPVGLADVITGRLTLDEALVAGDTENLTLLHSGTPDRNPTDLFSMPSVPRILEELRKISDIVIVDAPACAVVADALLLAPHVDCILHVVSAGSVERPVVREAAETLAAAGPKLMVFFVNRAPKDRSAAYHRYYYYGDGRRKRVEDRALVAADDAAVVEKEEA